MCDMATRKKLETSKLQTSKHHFLTFVFFYEVQALSIPFEGKRRYAICYYWIDGRGRISKIAGKCSTGWHLWYSAAPVYLMIVYTLPNDRVYIAQIFARSALWIVCAVHYSIGCKQFTHGRGAPKPWGISQQCQCSFLSVQFGSLQPVQFSSIQFSSIYFDSVQVLVLLVPTGAHRLPY